MLYPGNNRIVVHLIDETVRIVVVTEIKVEDGIARFGRDEGNGWHELFAAPLTSILYWD